MRRLHPLQIVCCLVGLSLLLLLLFFPNTPHWQCLAESFHELIEPSLPDALMCGGEVNDDQSPDSGNYRLELRLVTVPYCLGPHVVSPVSGYVLDPFNFMQQVQNDVRCHTLVFPPTTISDGAPATFRGGSLAIKVKKTNNQFQLDYTHDSVNNYFETFELSEGITFATNLGKHPVLNHRTGPSFHQNLSFLEACLSRVEVYQMESYLFLRYIEVGTKK